MISLHTYNPTKPYFSHLCICKILTCMRGTFTGGQDPLPPPKKNHKAVIAFLSNTDPLPLKNHKATKTAFNVGPSIGRGENDPP